MNLYEILGVKPNATIIEIKNAYRKKAVENHPDKEGGSPEKMAAINHAKDILTDPKKRERYDKTGNDGKEPSFESRFKQQMDNLLMQIVSQQKNDPDKVDVIGLMKESVQDAIDGLKESKQKTIEKLQRLLTIKKRTISKDKTIHKIIDIRIAEWNKLIALNSEDIKFAEDCLEFLKMYKYNFDKEPVRSMSGITINMM